jgi:hypothetical protein
MDLKPEFIFRQLAPIGTHLEFSLSGGTSPLGPLQELPGTWTGTGFNVIWRPNSTPGQDHFLELNLTNETLQFDIIPGDIPNRGFLQPDIKMFGVRYLQQIQDLNTKAGLHIEPGIWATVPRTEHPQEGPTVVRMASIPHGTTIIAQGIATASAAPPAIPDINISPFKIDDPAKTAIPFPETDLSKPSPFRSSPAEIVGITQAMVDNPNLFLKAAQAGQSLKNTVVLDVSSNATTPVLGGGVANTAFLQGSPDQGGPNAQAAQVSATFWIETVNEGGPDFHQLQYTQTVLLNFATLSWPHITVATLRKMADAA